MLKQGIDVQKISAVAKTVARQPRFVETILTPAERAVFAQRKGKHQIEFLAGRFSAKEAYSKALGTGMSQGLTWQDLEILPGSKGEPVFTKYPQSSFLTAHISISHSDDLVHSAVILESKNTMKTVQENQPVSRRRPAWLEISASALTHNIHYVRALTGTQRVCAVVKANAYGHGLAEVVPVALEAGADCFAVATIDEGIWLRDFGVTVPIFILGITPAIYTPDLAHYDLIPAVSEVNWLKAARQYLPKTEQLQLALAIDTGMGRIGFREPTALAEAIRLIDKTEGLELKSIWTHFATADGPNEAYFEKQLKQWHALTDDLPIADNVWRHVSNSGTSLWHQQPHPDMIRLGAAMYGFDPSQASLPARDLQPVLSLRAELVYVKQVTAGSSISYGATYKAKEDEWIGTLPLGYADGYRRALQGMEVLLPDGTRAPIVGRIAMDQCMVRLPGPLPEGTVVTLLGAVGDQRITLEELAEKAGTIPYEIATGMGQRLMRKVVG
ncbi:alanine racemase [Weissella halotolerans]|uniref:Multifunctional fusion protein n=1 Tax=Weissella halotolerans DSM 20190 TaxID=1123500 RepID=A0A0R2FSA7_9LACO|nr:alanine racemase [Weissella halotolerans]KRN31240.1 alanine racemase [Weissella halotolerans DSM 20190]